MFEKTKTWFMNIGLFIANKNPFIIKIRTKHFKVLFYLLPKNKLIQLIKNKGNEKVNFS